MADSVADFLERAGLGRGRLERAWLGAAVSKSGDSPRSLKTPWRLRQSGWKARRMQNHPRREEGRVPEQAAGPPAEEAPAATARNRNVGSARAEWRSPPKSPARQPRRHWKGRVGSNVPCQPRFPSLTFAVSLTPHRYQNRRASRQLARPTPGLPFLGKLAAYPTSYGVPLKPPLAPFVVLEQRTQFVQFPTAEAVIFHKVHQERRQRAAGEFFGQTRKLLSGELFRAIAAENWCTRSRRSRQTNRFSSSRCSSFCTVATSAGWPRG